MLVHDLEYAGSRSLTGRFERLLGTQASAPGALARLTARLRAGACDRALAAGVDPGSSPRLAARAAYLTAPRTRSQIAAGLERMVAFAQGPPRRWWAVSSHSPVLANADRLRELAALLRGETVAYAQGVAMLNQLLTDGSGPAYRGTVAAFADELARAHAAATAGLDHSH